MKTLFERMVMAIVCAILPAPVFAQAMVQPSPSPESQILVTPDEEPAPTATGGDRCPPHTTLSYVPHPRR